MPRLARVPKLPLNAKVQHLVEPPVKEKKMVLMSMLVVVIAFVVCLALAASSSPVYGFNAKAELSQRQDNAEAKSQTSARMGLSDTGVPMVKAAGMQ
jgi:cytoskeletal protein RodZ